MVHRFGWGLWWSTFEDYAQSSSRLPVGARTVHGLAYILIREIIRYIQWVSCDRAKAGVPEA